MIKIEVQNLEKNGFAIVENFIDDETASRLIENLDDVLSNTVANDSQRAGIRNLLTLSSEIKDFAESDQVRETIAPILGKRERGVRAIYFDKTPQANWKAAWHQDLSISVREKIETEGFNAWTIKDKIQHVQPPVWVLEQIVTLRSHLDDANETNGALRVIPQSHKLGRLGANQIQRMQKEKHPVLCPVGKVARC